MACYWSLLLYQSPHFLEEHLKPHSCLVSFVYPAYTRSYIAHRKRYLMYSNNFNTFFNFYPCGCCRSLSCTLCVLTVSVTSAVSNVQVTCTTPIQVLYNELFEVFLFSNSFGVLLRGAPLLSHPFSHIYSNSVALVPGLCLTRITCRF